MKRAELVRIARCATCRRRIGEASFPTFYRLTLERHGLHLPALMRAHGEDLMMGPLAGVLGADEDLTVRVMDPVSITICEDCSTKPFLVAALAELATTMAAEGPLVAETVGRPARDRDLGDSPGPEEAS